MNFQPLVSVLVANYNRSEFLEECIKSILKQTYSNIEINVIDDFSTDNSMKILNDLAKDDHRIKIQQNSENKGVGYTKKKLLDEAKGEILFIVDSDDAIVEYAIEILVNEHQNFPDAALIYSNHWVCDEKLKPTKLKSVSREIPKNESHLSYHGIGHLDSIKKEFYEKIDGLNPNLKVAVDQDLFYQMEEVGEVKFVDEKLYFYRQNLQSISLNSNKFEAAKAKIDLMKKAIDRRNRKNLQLKNPSNLYMKTLEWYAKNEIGRGNIFKAVPRAISQGNFSVLFGIFDYHLRGK